LLIAVIIATGFIAVNVLIGILLAPQQYSRIKRAIFECGMESQEGTWRQMHVRYYLVAILFVIFAVEGIFLFPWASILGDIGTFAFVEMLVFMTILFFGLVYAWRKGALEWR
jgi:NADH:ubiquinone oxidoreductase subunit 3 (subunit A)